MGFQYDSRSEVVWIAKRDPLPDVCCDCGHYSDNRVTVKHVELVTRPANESVGCLPILLTLFMQIALGSIWWLISAMMEGKETDETKIVKQKSKIKITQCAMCHGMKPPEVVETQAPLFSFLVHPTFKQQFEQLKRSAESS